MNANKTVTATFNTAAPPPPKSLTVTKVGTGNGTVFGSGINCGIDCTKTYKHGTTVTLQAKPKRKSVFAGWVGCSRVAGSKCILTMDTEKSVTAMFNNR